MSFIRNLSMAVPFLVAEMVAAETLNYGSLHHNSDIPNVLFLIGEIKGNDSFELRRAMRDHTIDVVVTASPGGNLYEGLQIAAILHDNKIGTYLPDGSSCESSCANIFLGGTNRLIVGELGVHQFYSGGKDADSSAYKSVTTAITQYTTADIIGIMNQFDTPPFVYEKMFGTADIYYFNGPQKARLNKGMDDGTFTARVAEIDNFLIKYPIGRARPTVPAVSEAVAVAPALPPNSVIPNYEDLVTAAMSFLVSINDNWSLPNSSALPMVATYYADNVRFYGKDMSLAEVLADKYAFAQRWPIRNYFVEPGSVRITCASESCAIDSIIAWAAASPQRGAKSSGSSTWSLILSMMDGKLKISSESGKTINRN